ncbi:metallo-beta-lactamase domain-containing protein 1-like [Ostrea edulis]|uniref:metallo-beta-lactamase domain-containing protein 1-like n=1 Tax=Ostrea edulis TaxID=37623 RepID=UPI00209496F7|nr:metallo-beta-lactamase domain-containing protein 1-like [Ostrea edulis]XP_048747315.1 metallo-beta-lactamase domain-containing protein 1-like [Ostrea edulis]XP_056005614.1 metallo-beta-lactamase domain-containing protein 1-like [Ostrea edulis]XP_056005615.1 metallo-beta-lactamase domain-containing protein 1-like [Ostrea edulis]
MYEVLVLKEGYSVSKEEGQRKTSGSITLLRGRHNIIVDTGNPWDKDLLLQEMLKYQLTPLDVDYVICTSGHPDKVGNLNLFTQAKHIVCGELCFEDNFFQHAFKQGIPYEIDDDVEVVSTPGQSGSDVSVLVRNTPLGTVAVAGGLFECFEDLEEPSLWQIQSEDPESQEQGRIGMLQIANHIIPGHGKMFQVPEDYKQHLRVVMYSEEHVHETTGNTVVTSVQSQYTVIEKDD